MRYKVETRDFRLSVKVWAGFRETLDKNMLASFCRIDLRGFLKPRLVRRNLLEYSGPIGMSIHERLKTPVTKREFLFIVEQLLIAVRKLRSNALPLECLIMDMRYAFINEETREVQFLYVPGYAPKQQTDVMSFLDSIIYAVRPAPEPDTEYISRFLHFLWNQMDIDLDQIEKFVAREDWRVIQTLQQISGSDWINIRQKPGYAHDNAGNQDEKDDAELPDEQWTVLPTELEDRILIHTATLHCVRTGESIRVNKPVFRIGEERSRVDYWVQDNNAVSRIHADIVTRGSKYYVIDINAKNRTYINDQPLVAQRETEIRDGDRLKLANEEYVFCV